jgi:hypothetical protein
MEPSKITLNRGFVAGLSLALSTLIILTVAVFKVLGLIIVAGALVCGFIAGIIVYMGGKKADKKMIHEVRLDK